jgi:hypothetical protein
MGSQSPCAASITLSEKVGGTGNALGSSLAPFRVALPPIFFDLALDITAHAQSFEHKVPSVLDMGAIPAFASRALPFVGFVLGTRFETRWSMVLRMVLRYAKPAYAVTDAPDQVVNERSHGIRFCCSPI